jgi:diguanylate cyclase
MMTPRFPAGSLPARIHLPRAIGLGLGGIAVGAALWQRGVTSPWLWAALVFNGLLWPHLGQPASDGWFYQASTATC